MKVMELRCVCSKCEIAKVSHYVDNNNSYVG